MAPNDAPRYLHCTRKGFSTDSGWNRLEKAFDKVDLTTKIILWFVGRDLGGTTRRIKNQYSIIVQG